jgi:hypothetical protein
MAATSGTGSLNGPAQRVFEREWNQVDQDEQSYFYRIGTADR